MLKVIKRILPKPVKKILITTKTKTYDQWQKKRLFEHMQLKHAELLQQAKGKEKIKVVFLVIHKSIWKVDSVFQKMLKDPLFEPEILVCPYTPYGEERMLEDMSLAYDYFKEKGYPVQKSLNNDGSWIKLEVLKPDLVFFTNPHDLTRKEYYEDAYLNYLSCYVPYHHEVVNNIEQFDQVFHVAQWKIFSTHQESLYLSRIISKAKGSNVIVTGYPAMEGFINRLEINSYKNAWKSNDGRLRVIWAPHHSIELNKDVPYSNFLKYSNFFKKIAKKYSNKIVWSFKPHPMLKEKLYDHPDWGITNTDSYYKHWETQEYSQLDEGEYTDLFLSSSAMIHDSGSFLAEYLYMKKPVMYLLADLNLRQHYSNFGISALSSCVQGKSEQDIGKFIEELIDGKMLKKEHEVFLNDYVLPYFEEEKPSDRIINFLSRVSI